MKNIVRMGRVPKRSASTYTSLTRYHLSQLAEPSITQVRCCCIATPPVRTLRVVANRETEPTRRPSTLPEAYCPRCQVPIPTGPPTILIPFVAFLSPSRKTTEQQSPQPTKHLPLQGCNTIGTIHTSRPDLSRKKQISMHITSHSKQFDTIFHTPPLSKRQKGGGGGVGERGMGWGRESQ
jgi:hypothetical protein